MNPDLRSFFPFSRISVYKRHAPLILINGLAEQNESWFRNRAAWSRFFDVKVPDILVYNGAPLHRHIESGLPVTVDYLVDRLATFLDEFVQKPPYHLVGSSLGGQVVLTYAHRYPANVAKLVVLCPSGIHGEEHLPIMEGVKRNQYDTLVNSVFHTRRFAGPELIHAFETKFHDRRWKKGVLHTVRGTMKNSVFPILSLITHPTLFIWGANDLVLADVPGALRAASIVPNATQVVIPQCGHAPQIERAGLVNNLVQRFLRDKLKDVPPALTVDRFFQSRAKPSPKFARLLMNPITRA